MLWLAVIVLLVAVVLAVGVGVAAWATHVRDRTPLRGECGSHRADASGRHRSGMRSAGGSVAGLRAREDAEGMRMFPGGGGGSRP